MSNPRFDDWVDSLDHPPTREDRFQYVADAKAHPTAETLKEGWIMIGPLPDPYGEDGVVEIYEILHESGEYGQQLLIDKMAGYSSLPHARHWAWSEIARGEYILAKA